MSTRLLVLTLIAAVIVLVLAYLILYNPLILKRTFSLLSNVTSNVQRELWSLQHFARQIAQIVLPNELNACSRACSLEQVLKCYFKVKYIDKIGSLIFYNSSIENLTTAEKVWITLWWISNNIKYNYTKARLQTFCVQTPYETIVKRSGVCVDYAVLTAALLLYLNVSPVYITVLRGVGHAVTIVKVNGVLFVLDQHLPPIEIQDYAQYLVGLRAFNNVTIYELSKIGNRIVIREFNKNIFQIVDDYPEDNVSKSLVIKVIELVSKATGRVPDKSLQLFENVNVYTYRLKRLVGIVINNRTVYVPLFKLYDPVFKSEWAKWLALTIVKAFSREFRKNERFWISINSTCISAVFYNYSICKLNVGSRSNNVVFYSNCTTPAVGIAIYVLNKYERPVLMILRSGYISKSVPYINGVWNISREYLHVLVPRYEICRFIKPEVRYVVFLIGKRGEIRGVGEFSGYSICSTT